LPNYAALVHAHCATYNIKYPESHLQDTGKQHRALVKMPAFAYATIMIKITTFLTALFFFFAAPAFAQTPGALDFGPKEKLTITSGDKTHEFQVEVADTLELQARGLMYRDSLPLNEGMLFEFEEPKVATIWMKNTAIFLDIIFVKENGEILKIEHFARPYTLRRASSEAPVAAVLELPGGRSRALGIEPGDTLNHSFFDNK